MSGNLAWTSTGSDEIDEVLSAVELAGDMYHNTANWHDKASDDDESPSEMIHRIACKVADRLTARLAAAEKESELRKKEAAHSKLGIWTENPGVMLWVEPRPFGFSLVFRSGNEVVGEYAFAEFRRLRVSSAIDAALANAAGEEEAHD